MGRMDKYSNNIIKSRASRNQKLYDEVSDINIDYIDINYNNAVVIDTKNMTKKSRESYQKVRQLGGLVAEKESPDDYTPIVKEDRIYDINEILRKAKEDRNNDDQKKRLINTEYNILSKLDINKLENEDLSKDDLHKIIDTIYENDGSTKRKKHNDSDLMQDMMESTTTTVTITRENNIVTPIVSDIVSAADVNENNVIDIEKEKNNIEVTKPREIVDANEEEKHYTENEDEKDTRYENKDVTRTVVVNDADDESYDDTTEKFVVSKKNKQKNMDSSITDTALRGIDETEELEHLEKKSKVALFIILLIIFILLVVGGYLVYKYFGA